MARLLCALALLAVTSVAAAAQPAPEVARVRAHLAAAREVVTAHDVSHLTAAQRTNRGRALAVLDRYIARGVFPLRTGDSFGALRPRFIDARGVHCAVGEMIAQTGHANLARAIARDFEYAYVHDIDSPGLLSWAHDYGFTVDELARIQPGYSAPPTPEDVRDHIDEHKDTFMLACADAPPPAKVTIQIAGDRDGRVSAKAPDGATAFARCFASGADANLPHYGGAMTPSPTAFSQTIMLTLRTPAQVLDTRLQTQIGFAPQCAPRPGALARRATLSITNTPEDGFTIAVKTEPANAQIARCIEDYLEPQTRAFHGVAQLAYTHRWDLPRMSERAIHDAVMRAAPRFATDCYTKETAPQQVTLDVSAKPDDKAFTLSAGEANADFARCVTDKLHAALRQQFTVARGTTRPYFRIDNEIRTRVIFAVETPAARDARLAREKKRVDADRRALEAELKRRRYEL